MKYLAYPASSCQARIFRTDGTDSYEGAQPAFTSAFWGLVVVLVSVVFALVGQHLVQSTVSVQVRESHNTALGMIYAAIYVLYALWRSLFLCS